MLDPLEVELQTGVNCCGVGGRNRTQVLLLDEMEPFPTHSALYGLGACGIGVLTLLRDAGVNWPGKTEDALRRGYARSDCGPLRLKYPKNLTLGKERS